MSCTFLMTERRISPHNKISTLEFSFSSQRSSFSSMCRFRTSIMWKWLWIQTYCLRPNSVFLICKTRHWTPVCLALPNRLIGHNDFIIWVLKWDNRQFFQSASRLITNVKGRRHVISICPVTAFSNYFHSSLFYLKV